MTISSTEQLQALDMILPSRPAGRNIIGFAVDTIQKLRAEIAEKDRQIEVLRGSLDRARYDAKQ